MTSQSSPVQFESEMFPVLQSDEPSGSGLTSHLVVTGQASLEDLWVIFSSFGEVSSIELSETAAKVTFCQEEALSRFHQSGEITVGSR